MHEEPLTGYKVRPKYILYHIYFSNSITYNQRLIFVVFLKYLLGLFQVRVWETDKDVSQANDTEVLIGHRLETTITNLTPGKTYYLRVLAYSQVMKLVICSVE